MAKDTDVQVAMVTRENMDHLLDHFCDLFDSGNAKGFGYGSSSGDVWVDLGTGDVEITSPDGIVEKISGTDPRAQAFWDPFGNSHE